MSLTRLGSTGFRLALKAPNGAPRRRLPTRHAEEAVSQAGRSPSNAIGGHRGFVADFGMASKLKVMAKVFEELARKSHQGIEEGQLSLA